MTFSELLGFLKDSGPWAVGGLIAFILYLKIKHTQDVLSLKLKNTQDVLSLDLKHIKESLNNHITDTNKKIDNLKDLVLKLLQKNQ